VLRLHVTPHVHLALERSTARVARERFEAGVFAAMRDEVRGLAEGLATVAALVRLLT